MLLDKNKVLEATKNSTEMDYIAHLIDIMLSSKQRRVSDIRSTPIQTNTINLTRAEGYRIIQDEIYSPLANNPNTRIILYLIVIEVQP